MERRSRAVTCDRTIAVLGILGLFVLATGCSAKRDVRAGNEQALEAALAEAASAGTPAPIPSLDPSDTSLQVAAPAPARTAPPPDEFDKDDPAHLIARCRDRGARHELFDAVADCRRAAELDPKSIEPHAELMQLLVDLQSYAEAEISAKTVLAARPNDAVALYYLAWSYRGRDQFPEAIAALQKAIAIDPKRLEYVQALALSYRLAGNYGKSMETLQKAHQMQPSNEKTMSMADQTRTELAEKLAPYRRLVKEHPDSYDNQSALGFMYQKHGILEKALTTYDTALSMIPTPLDQQQKETKKIAAQVYYNRGVVYRDLGKPDLAEPSLWQSMQLDPSLSAFAWYYIGLARYDSGKLDPSIDALRKSIDLAPDVADNRSALADAYDKAGKADLAAEQRNAVAAIRSRQTVEKDRIRKEDADAEAEALSRAPAAPAASPTPEDATAETPRPVRADTGADAPAASSPAAPAGPEPGLDPGKR
jgi:tetratricopeptide (TPR) repeat protein